MSLDADLIVDRRRMRRKLTFWRVVAIAVIVLAIGAAAAAVSRRGLVAGPYIARVTITGLIRDDEERVRQLDRLARSSAAKAVILHVDSPGGTTAGSEQLFDALGRVRAKKPIAVVVDSMAASGAYITAISGDYIVAKQTSLVGSIGVLFEYPNFTDLLGQDRRQGRIDQIDAAQGGAERLRAHQPGSARGDPIDHHGFLRLVQRPGAGSPAYHRRRSSPRSTTAACSPAIRGLT